MQTFNSLYFGHTKPLRSVYCFGLAVYLSFNTLQLKTERNVTVGMKREYFGTPSTTFYSQLIPKNGSERHDSLRSV